MSKKGNGKPPRDPDLFDIKKARAGKEEGMERVLEKEDEFKIRIAQFIDNKIEHHWEGIFEEIRIAYLASKDCIHPHHPNCWGAVTNAAIKRGTIVKIGSLRVPTGIKSHGRPVNVLRRV